MRVGGRTRPRIAYTQQYINRVGLTPTIGEHDERLRRLELAPRGIRREATTIEINQFTGPAGPPGIGPHLIISPTHIDTAGIPFAGAVLTYNGVVWEPVAPPLGGFFHADFIVDANWAGAQGQVKTTVTGSTVRLYTTIQGAIDAADADNAPRTIYIIAGTYAENLTIPATFSSSAHHLHIFGESRRRVTVAPATGNALVIASGSPVFHITDIQLQGASGSFSVKGTATNISAEFADCRFTRKVSADFAGTYFRRSSFDEGYQVDSSLGHTPSTVYFTDCDFTGTSTWAGQIEQHYFENCEWGAAADVIVSTGTLDGVFFDSCVFDTSGAVATKFTKNGGSCADLSFVDCDFGIPAVNGNIYLQKTSGCNGIRVTGCNFAHSAGSTNPYIKATKPLIGDAVWEGVEVVGNNFQRAGSGNYIEDDGGIGITGEFKDSVFGPNTPPCFDIEFGSDSVAPNMYFGCGTVSGGGASTVTEVPGTSIVAHNILDGGTAHLDSAADTVSRGSLIVGISGSSTVLWDELVIGPSNSWLFSNGVDASWQYISGSAGGGATCCMTGTASIFYTIGSLQNITASLVTRGTAPNIQIVLNHGATSTTGWMCDFMVPRDWDAGAVDVILHYAKAAAGTGDIVHRLNHSLIAIGDDIAESGTSSDQTIAVAADPASTRQIVTWADVFTPSVIGEFWRLNYYRIGGDAADTYAGTMDAVALEFQYSALMAG